MTFENPSLDSKQAQEQAPVRVEKKMTQPDAAGDYISVSLAPQQNRCVPVAGHRSE
jgi:hypothetical protein